MNKLVNWIKQNISISLFFVAMIPVYVYGMFFNRPWYDELYTYYYFVSRGPIYAAIHWPVPNNHMGYSVLSGFLSYFGNPYIALRGISVICALANIILLYVLLKKLFGRYELVGVALYVGAYLVHSLAFQGRGYTLSTMCLLIAFNLLYEMCIGDMKIRYLIGWAINLAFALYTIPSNLYWVLPVCLTGGAYLLAHKDYKKLIRLIIWSLVAAVLTVLAYSMVWLAIGSNLVCKDANSTYYGLSQVKVILKAPFLAWNTGMQYMLATPYIQSSDRMVVITGLGGYFRDLFNLYYSNMGVVVIVVYVVAVVLAVIEIIRCQFWKMQEHSLTACRQFFSVLIVAVFGIVLPAMLIIQSVQPYKRVFSYFATIIAVMVVMIFDCVDKIIINRKDNSATEESKVTTKDITTKDKQALVRVVIGVCAAFVAYLGVWSSSYKYDLAGRENDIHDALEQIDINDIQSIYYTDDYQMFVLKFYYDKVPQEMTLEEAQYVLVSSDLRTEEGQKDWPMLTVYGDFKIDYVDDNFEKLVHTEKYDIYRRKPLN